MSQTPLAILSHMRSVNPSSPRLVWHGREGRIELSGRVFDNWVAKSSNLLVDELDAESGTTVELDLPVHWKSLALAFACWQVGCSVSLPGPAHGTGGGTDVSGAVPSAADIVVTSRSVPALDPPRLLVCVALGPLALGWEGPLPRGAVDFAAEVRSHGDAYVDPTEAGTTALLVRTGAGGLTVDELARSVVETAHAGIAGEAPQAAPGVGPTVLLEPGTDLGHALAAALTVWRQDGALVLVEDGVPVTERLLTGERVTGRLVPA